MYRPFLIALLPTLVALFGLSGALQAQDAELADAASRGAIVRDWMLQDYMSIALPEHLERQKLDWQAKHIQAPESKPDAPVLAKLACFTSDADSIVERRMVDRVLEETGQSGRTIRDEVEKLTGENVPGADPRWKDAYLRACELRRAERLRPLLDRWTRFVFNQHHHIPNTWKYTEGLSDAQSGRFFKPGASLNVLDMDGPYGKVRTLIDDPDGMLRNPDVSHDGRRILFAWKKSDRKDDYHLYEMDVATRAVRQLTHGPGVADYEGIYLPGGNITFSSTRPIQTVDCNWTEVSNLYLMDGDGRFMRRIGFDQVHTIFPTATDDGRVLYTRWDYNDRGQIYTQPLFQMNADGTNQCELYGGSSWFPTNIVHARQIPGTRKVLAIITGHHTGAHGKLGIIDPGVGRQEGRGVQLIAPIRHTEPIRVDKYGLGGNQFQHPYPLDERRFLVTLALPGPDGEIGRFNIYFMDSDGRRELLVEGKESGHGMGCKQIVPLAKRNIPYVRPGSVDYRKKSGTFYVQDVYKGAGLEGIPRGTVKRLRVVALEFRAAGIGMTKQTGAGFSNVSTPIAVGNGSWDTKVVLGSATVHQDGSAFFKAPARMPVYFQALDEKNYVVQTMRSWATLMPGENQSCVGCHEHKNRAPHAGLPTSLAMEAGPQELAPFFGPPRGFSFTRQIQPILDRHCVECHDGPAGHDGPGGDPPNLSGRTVHLDTMKRHISKSYLSLTHTEGTNGDYNHPIVNWINCMSGPAMLPPYHKGAATSRLMQILEEGHEGTALSPEELEKIACWIDLLVPYCGDYLEAHAWSPEEQDLYARFSEKRKRQEEFERQNIRALIEYQTAGKHAAAVK